MRQEVVRLPTNQRLVLRSVDQSEMSIVTTLTTNPSSPCHQGQHGVGESQVGDEHQGHSPSRTLKQLKVAAVKSDDT